MVAIIYRHTIRETSLNSSSTLYLSERIDKLLSVKFSLLKKRTIGMQVCLSQE